MTKLRRFHPWVSISGVAAAALIGTLVAFGLASTGSAAPGQVPQAASSSVRLLPRPVDPPVDMAAPSQPSASTTTAPRVHLAAATAQDAARTSVPAPVETAHAVPASPPPSTTGPVAPPTTEAPLAPGATVLVPSFDPVAVPDGLGFVLHGQDGSVVTVDQATLEAEGISGITTRP